MKDLLRGTALLLALGLAAGPLAAQEFGEWDADADMALTEEEFGTGFGEAGVFNEWDADDDDLVSRDEFNAGLFGAWDRDDDEQLTEAEFNEGWERWGAEGEADFAGWDADQGGFLNEEEFGAGWGEEGGLFADWGGTEEGLGEEEFTGGAFGLYDADEDAAIAESEWEEDGLF